MTPSEKVVSFFHRHVVPVLFTFQKGRDIRDTLITTFVLSVADHWFLITAGHCISEIEEITEKFGYEITRCQLIDSLGEGAKHLNPILFSYKRSHPTCLSDSYSFDYGIMVLSQYYRQLLETNNVQALNEEAWKKQPTQVDFYLLLGIASESVKIESASIETTATLHPIEPIDSKPDGFADTDVPLFYGRIVLGSEVKSIKGMSGGPIFAFHQNEKGELRYWLTALQSRWLPESHYIAACPTKILGHFIEDSILPIWQE